MKALIAERDCKAIDDITRAFNLSFPDWELIITDSGKECLNRVKNNSLDLIILGLDLADMSGFNVAKGIRSFSNTAIIVLSSKNDGISLVKALHSGADQCIEKPFHQLELVARIKALLRRVS
jgi:two-component system response regulator VicR